VLPLPLLLADTAAACCCAAGSSTAGDAAAAATATARACELAHASCERLAAAAGSLLLLLPAKLLMPVLHGAAVRGAVACRGVADGVRRSARRERRPRDCRLLRRIVLLWLQCTPLMAPTAGHCDLL
jgi:hypothetical protein